MLLRGQGEDQGEASSSVVFKRVLEIGKLLFLSKGVAIGQAKPQAIRRLGLRLREAWEDSSRLLESPLGKCYELIEPVQELLGQPS